jgi:cytochrome c553
LRDEIGARKSAEPRKHNAQQMVDFMAAAWYASLPATVPTGVKPPLSPMRSQEGMWLPHEKRAHRRSAPGDRNANVDRELRDPHAGSSPLCRPARWQKAGAWRPSWIASCHGAGLRGATTAPAIAGRSPSYLARQIMRLSRARGMAKWRRLDGGGQAGPAAISSA